MELNSDPVITTEEKSNTATIVAVIIVLAIAAVGLWYFMGGPGANKTYKDGTYNASGNYTSPAGNETIDVQLTIKDGIVTDATFTGQASDRESKSFQEKFASGFKAQVIGKAVKDISLNVVNGSSLTTKGFMSALEKIKNQA